MSVLKNKRTQSKIEYLYNAYTISVETMGFIKGLSARYSRVLGDRVTCAAFELLEHAQAAESIYPSDAIRERLRYEHLLEARAKLSYLDILLTLCYEMMTKNPEGAFTTAKGRTLTSSEALTKLERMSENLGNLIDKENALLSGAIGKAKPKISDNKQVMNPDIGGE